MQHFFNKDLQGKFCSLPYNTASLEKDPEGYNLYTCWCGAWTSVTLDSVEHGIKSAWHNLQASKIRQSVESGDFYYCNNNGCSYIHNLDDRPNIIPSVTTLPTQLTIRIDSSCNLACPTCRLKVFHDKENYDNHVKILNQVINEYKDFDQEVLVMLDASGDFLASKAYRDTLFSDKFPKCFKYQLMSNGTLLTKFKHLIQQIKNNIDVISITFDASSPETYAKTRIGGNWEDLIQGVLMLNDMNISWIGNFIVQKDNMHEIESFYNLCKQLGAQQINYGGVNFWSHMSQEYYNQQKVETIAKQTDLSILFNLQHQDPMYIIVQGELNHYR